MSEIRYKIIFFCIPDGRYSHNWLCSLAIIISYLLIKYINKNIISVYSMLPHNHNGSLTFLVKFKLSNLKKEIKNSLMIIS